MRAVGLGLLLAAATPACVNVGPAPYDLATPDLAIPDLRPPDLSMPDLFQPDLAPPTITGAPTDCVDGVTTAQIYDQVIGPKCATEFCHLLKSAAELQSKWVGVASEQAPQMPFVTPMDIDRSYVVYKIFNQQGKVTKRQGMPMPRGGPMLGNDDLCRFISWIKGGAM